MVAFYKQEELAEVLLKHKLWLQDKEGGERANLRGVTLRGFNLQGVNLREANLREANMQGVNLREANMQGVNLQGVNLQWANMRGANIYYSCWPLWCGSNGVIVDKRIAQQLATHFCALD